MKKLDHNQAMPVNYSDKNCAVYLSDLSPTDKTWDEHKTDSELVRMLYSYSQDFKKYAYRISQCSGILKFGIADGKLVLKKSEFCRCRYCAVCQWRRAMLWRAVMFQKLPIITEMYPTHRWVFLTLTVRNCPIGELKDTLQHMNESWQRLIQTKAYKGVVDGFIRTTEVTRGKDNPNHAHPHFHAMLLVKPSYFGKGYIKQMEWVEMWAKALRVDYLPSVNVQAVRAYDGEQVSKAICETLKYSVKPSDLSVQDDNGAWLHEMTRQTHKMRFIATGGVLKGILKPEDKITNEDMITTSEEPVQTDERRLAFVFVPSRQKYVYNPRLSENIEF